MRSVFAYRKNTLEKCLALLMILFLCFGAVAQNRKTDSLFNLLKTSKEDTVKVKILNQLAGSFYRTDTDTALYFSTRAQALAEKLSYRRGTAHSLHTQGLISLAKGDFNESIQMAEKSLEIFQALNDKDKIANCYMLLGNAYSNLDILPKALEYHFKALKLKEEVKDEQGISRTLMNIGRVYRVQSDFPQALSYYHKALDLAIKNDDKVTIGNCLNNIGNVHFYQQKWDSALAYQYKSLIVNQKAGNKDIAFTNFSNIAAIYHYQRKFDSSLYYYKKVLEYNESNKDKDGIATCYQGIAANYHEMGRQEEAKIYFVKALELAKEMGSLVLLEGLYKDLSEVYEKSGNFKEALYHFKQHKLLYDSMYNSDNTKKLTEVSLRYEFEKKEQLEREEQGKKEIIQAEHNKRQQQLIRVFIIGIIVLIIFLALIARNYRQKQKINLELENKNKIIQEKNKDITDSIHYAKRLQDAMLPPSEQIKEYFSDAFVFFKPKDIVSGDFYWFEKIGEKIFFAAVDCTGHGVPGAFMSIVAHNILKQAVREKKLTDPGEILNMVNEELSKTLKQQSDSEVQDGMDIALCCLNLKSATINFSGANNPLLIVRDLGLIEISPDKVSLGPANKSKFVTRSETVKPGDMLYIFSDGYADQFGGEKGKKMMKKNFKNRLNSIHALPCGEQSKLLSKELELWQGMLEQLDDILVIGIRV